MTVEQKTGEVNDTCAATPPPHMGSLETFTLARLARFKRKQDMARAYLLPSDVFSKLASLAVLSGYQDALNLDLREEAQAILHGKPLEHVVFIPQKASSETQNVSS